MKLLAVLAVALISTNVTACPSDLIGKWKSDQAASIAFAHAHSKLEPRAKVFLAALYGHMTLTFSERDLHVVMPEVEVPVAGVLKPFAGLEERKPYTVLFCNAFTIVFSAKQSFGTDLAATTFNFVDPDTFWVYAGGTDPSVPDLHTREFFRRVR